MGLKGPKSENFTLAGLALSFFGREILLPKISNTDNYNKIMKLSMCHYLLPV